MGKLMLNDRCYTGSDNLLMLNDESYSGGRIANLIEKNITANGTYSASDDEADGYSEVNVDVQAKLSPVAFTDATHIEQRNRTITISDYEIVAQISTETTYCTGVITLPITNFTKDEFVMEYSITTPSAVGGNYFARCFFSDAVPTNPWTEYENYGYTQLAQSSSDWSGIMQRFEIPSGASYFNIEVGATSFSSIKLYEEAQPTLISKTITENGTYFAKDDGATGYSKVTVNVSGGSDLWLLNPIKSEAMCAATITGGSYTPCVYRIQDHDSGGYPNLATSVTFGDSTKAVIMRGGYRVGCLLFGEKILGGVYNKLYFECMVTSGGTGNYHEARIDITSDLAMSSGGIPTNILKEVVLVSDSMTSEQINAQSGVVINSTDNLLLSAQTVEIDISSISTDFYVGFWNCDRSIYIRSVRVSTT